MVHSKESPETEFGAASGDPAGNVSTLHVGQKICEVSFLHLLQIRIAPDILQTVNHYSGMNLLQACPAQARNPRSSHTVPGLQMVRMLICYYSRSGNTKKMAYLIQKGVM